MTESLNKTEEFKFGDRLLVVGGDYKFRVGKQCFCLLPDQPPAGYDFCAVFEDTINHPMRKEWVVKCGHCESCKYFVSTCPVDCMGARFHSGRFSLSCITNWELSPEWAKQQIKYYEEKKLHYGR